MNRIWRFVKTHFLTRKFLTFGIIGVVNTAIDSLVYLLFFDLLVPDVVFVARGVGFIVASIFSYFANALFTFKPESRNASQFGVVMTVFLIRMLVTMGLAEAINYVVETGIGIDYGTVPIAKLITPVMSSAIMIPIAYFALDAAYRRFGGKRIR
ncbi:MAG: GtrA family protein [Candidatus Izemoplasmatales bacterium]